MKKIYLPLLLSMLFLLGTLTVSANYVYDTNFDTGIISVKGTVPEARINRMVLITVLAPGESAENVKITDNSTVHAVTTDENGYFNHSFYLDASSLSGNYNYSVVISAYDMADYNVEKFFFCHSNVLTPVLGAIANASSKEQVESVFAANSSILDFVYSELLKLSAQSRDEIYSGLAKSASFANVEEFKEAYYDLFIPRKMSSCSISSEILTVLNDYEKYINTSSLNIYEDFSKLSPELKNGVYSYMTKINSTTMNDVHKSFIQGSLLKLIKTTQNISQVEKLLNSYALEAGVSLTTVQSAKEPGIIYADLVGGDFADIPALQNALDDSVDSGGTSNGTNGSTGGGSGGGGGTMTFSKEQIQSDIPQPVGGDVVESETETGFVDLEDVLWAKDAIESLNKQGIVNGYGGNIFEPNRIMAREEFVTVMVRAFGLFDADAESSFSDVAADEWYYPYISSANSENIINGVGNDEFGVGLPVTRQDVAAIMARVAENKNATLEQAREYEEFADDEAISDYARESIVMLYCAKIINGNDAKEFNPQISATRAECCVMINNMLLGGVQ